MISSPEHILYYWPGVNKTWAWKIPIMCDEVKPIYSTLGYNVPTCAVGNCRLLQGEDDDSNDDGYDTS